MFQLTKENLFPTEQKNAHPHKQKTQNIMGYVKELHVSTDAKTIYTIPNRLNHLSFLLNQVPILYVLRCMKA